MGSGFPSEKGRDGGINGKKWAGKWELGSLLGTLYYIQVTKGQKNVLVDVHEMTTNGKFPCEQYACTKPPNNL